MSDWIPEYAEIVKQIGVKLGAIPSSAEFVQYIALPTELYLFRYDDHETALAAYPNNIGYALPLVYEMSFALLHVVATDGKHQYQCLLNHQAFDEVEAAMMNGGLFRWYDYPALAVCKAWLAHPNADR